MGIVADAIEEGLNNFLKGLTNDIIRISTSTTNSTSPTGTAGMDLIYEVATYTPNPFTFSPVIALKSFAEDVFFEALAFILILAVISFIIHRMTVPQAASIRNLTGINLGSGINKVLFVVVGGIGIFAFESAFLWMVLLINDELSKAIILPSLNAIAMSPDNLFLYIFLGVSYSFLMFCFYFRTLIILFWAAFGIIIGALMLIPKTQNWAVNAHYYLIQMVFMQFAIVAWYSFCIVIIKGCPEEMQNACYLMMVLVSMYFSYKFIFGIDIIKTAGKVVKYAV